MVGDIKIKRGRKEKIILSIITTKYKLNRGNASVIKDMFLREELI